MVSHSRNWFKGADTVSFCKFLEGKYKEVIRDDPDHTHIAYLSAILDALVACNKFFGMVYRAGVWLTQDERDLAISTLGQFLGAFSRAADYAFQTLHKTRFKFQPKFHMIAEVRHLLIVEAGYGGETLSINPLVWATQCDEDFVGRVAALSRKVSSRTLHKKTIERYLISLAAAW